MISEALRPILAMAGWGDIDDVIAHEPYAIAEAPRERCRLETECFFSQSKLLLERIAQTVPAYFGFQLNIDGSMRSHFKNRIKKLWSQRTGESMPKQLHALMRELDRDVIQFRDRHIEHVPDPVQCG
jgi:hypothetical protein